VGGRQLLAGATPSRAAGQDEFQDPPEATGLRALALGRDVVKAVELPGAPFGLADKLRSRHLQQGRIGRPPDHPAVPVRVLN